MKKQYSITQFKKIIRTKYFRSIFTTLLLICSFVFLLGYITITAYTNKKLTDQLETLSEQIAINIDSLLNAGKNNALFIGTLKSVDTVLSVENPSLDQLARMVSDVSPFLDVYNYETIELFFERSQRIFDAAGGMYYWNDYFNQSYLTKLTSLESEEAWITDTPYTRYYGPDSPVDVIRFARKLPLYGAKCSGYISISIPMQKLSSTIEKTLKNTDYPTMIYLDGQPVWSSSEKLNDWDRSLTLSANEQLLFPNTKRCAASTPLNTQCTFYLSNNNLISSYSALGILLLSYLLVVLIMGIISYVTTLFMQKPVDEIMNKIGSEYLPDCKNGRIDEFAIMNKALDNMTSQMKNISSVISQNEHLMQERLLLGILYNQLNIHDLDCDPTNNGIAFPNAYFAVVVVSLPDECNNQDYSYREQIRLVVRNNIKEAFSSLGTTYTLYNNDNTITALINTDHYDCLQNDLAQICAVLRESIRETFKLHAIFSICMCSQQDPVPAQAYLLARRNIIFPSMGSDTFLFFSNEYDASISIKDEYVFQTTQCIIDQDIFRLKKIITIVSNEYFTPNIALEERKRITIFFLSSVLTELLGLGVNLPMTQFISYFSKIQETTHITQCDKLMFECLAGLANEKSKVPKESHNYVRQVMDYIESHYAEPITIPQIAETININSIYLNKVFKLATGKTLSEYLNYYRVEQSKKLLLDMDLPIAKISELIGYNDVRSYTRFFKKFHNLTPTEYRANELQ